MINNQAPGGFLQAPHSDIRLEVILADLLSGNMGMEDLVIESEGLFKRNYHHEIESCGEIAFGAGRKKKLRFVVNREGLYDQLPEDLFHEVSETTGVTDKYEMIQEMKEHRDLEKQTRLFFQPLEHEFYTQRVKLEIEEQKLLFETNNSVPGEIFDQLWQLPDLLDDHQKSKLGLLMPLIHTLTGKIDLLSFVFERITGDPVEIKKTVLEKYRADKNPILGDMQLSVDSTLGGSLGNLQTAYTISIFISNVENLAGYMPSGKQIVLHEFLCNLFMPLDAEIIFETAFTSDTATFVIESDTVSHGRLNYTTII